MIWTSTLQIRKHGYFGDFSFIILLFVGILPLYAINTDADHSLKLSQGLTIAILSESCRLAVVFSLRNLAVISPSFAVVRCNLAVIKWIDALIGGELREGQLTELGSRNTHCLNLERHMF
ncbi:unnamed protein product [Trifolium pratense]|uniref:Uncharacterized protein n=1 Tax=Trifolium pratense TaxID=57577 RepID=A0ACB0JT84_TRIPR|nr:unnamed protein product [Trifolium pratense]